MLLSKRRLKWGVICFSIMCLLIFVRPPRTWLDQALVRRLDPDLRVARIQYLTGPSVVQLRDLAWHKNAASEEFGFLSQNAWLAIDRAAMKRGQLLVPRAELENATLYLESDRAPTSNEDNPWLAELASHIGKIDWREIHRTHFEKLAPAQTQLEVRRKIDSMIRESAAIEHTVQQLASEFRFSDNPLRHEQELVEKLAKLEQLILEHQGLSEQLNRVQTNVASTGENLQSQLEAVSQSVVRRTLQHSGITNSQQRVASSMIQQYAFQQWQELADYGRVSGLVATRMPIAPITPDSGGASSTPSLRVNALSAKGTFAHQRIHTPFTMTAALSNDRLGQSNLRSEWSYFLPERGKTVGITVTRESVRPSVEFELHFFEASRETPSPSDRVSNAAATDSPQRGKVLPQLSGTSNGASLNGNLSLLLRNTQATTNTDGQVHADNPLSQTPPLGHQRSEDPTALGTSEVESILSAAISAAASPDTMIELKISGSWLAPQFEIDAALPTELTDAVGREFYNHVAEANRQAQDTIQAEFSQEVSNLNNLVAIAIDNGNLILEMHRNKIESATKTMRRQVAALTGASAFSTANRDSHPNLSR